MIFAGNTGPLPFDVGLLRAMPYKLGSDGGPGDADRDGQALTKRLVDARAGLTDSTLFQLIDDHLAPGLTVIARGTDERPLGSREDLGSAPGLAGTDMPVAFDGRSVGGDVPVAHGRIVDAQPFTPNHSM
ncbi:hypothetical protein [Rubrivivax gelatinosus]|uniref:Uncharacterized protein n=1 Tax=Rubrivivax gelatinosus TaxID=28068 RepID=A0A4R2MKC2_RUBGE|nr:hypothetical protein [Rubrivivax gelatinosus]TCP03396.1 hypothetical protein EV684_104117 [Rubrivivax gelatinosus]